MPQSARDQGTSRGCGESVWLEPREVWAAGLAGQTGRESWVPRRFQSSGVRPHVPPPHMLHKRGVAESSQCPHWTSPCKGGTHMTSHSL